jgi:hypothetical protein
VLVILGHVPELGDKPSSVLQRSQSVGLQHAVDG